MAGGPLIHFPDARRSELFEAGYQLVESAGGAVDIDVQPVLHGLVFGDVLEQQPPALTDTGDGVERVVRVPDRGEAAEESAAAVFGDGTWIEVAGGEQPVDQRGLIFRFVFQGRGPEVGDGGRVRAVDDEFPTQAHVTSYSGYMTSGASPGLTLRSRSGVDYHFDPGALCLELLPTGGPGPYRVYEILHTPADLATWAGRSRLTPTPELTITAAEVTAARHLRDTLFEIARARSHGESSPAGDLDVLNEFAAATPLTPRITATGARAWTPSTGIALLSTVARDAIDLLTGPHAGRIRTCSATDCQLIYVDTSRPGRRRWCSMEHCGNLNKVRAHRARTPEKEG